MASLMELNDDCLHQIFKKLRNKDLINLLLASERFKDPVRRNFKVFQWDDIEAIRYGYSEDQAKLIFSEITYLKVYSTGPLIWFMEQFGTSLQNIKRLHLNILRFSRTDLPTLRPLFNQVKDLTLSGPARHETNLIQFAVDLKKAHFDGRLMFNSNTVRIFLEKNKDTMESLILGHKVQFFDDDTLNGLNKFKCLKKISICLPGFQNNLNKIFEVLVQTNTVEDAKFIYSGSGCKHAYGFFEKSSNWDGEICPYITMTSLKRLTLTNVKELKCDELKIENFPNLEVLTIDIELILIEILRLIWKIPSLQYFGLLRCAFKDSSVMRIEKFLMKRYRRLEIGNTFEKDNLNLEFLSISNPLNDGINTDHFL